MQGFRNTQENDPEYHLPAPSLPQARQGIATTCSPSGPVDLVIIEERECEGAIRYQDGLEGIHLQDENGWVRGSHDPHSPSSPQ